METKTTWTKQNPLIDEAYGNEFYQEGQSWFGRFSFRSPRYTQDDCGAYTDWQALNKDDTRQVQRLADSQ